MNQRYWQQFFQGIALRRKMPYSPKDGVMRFYTYVPAILYFCNSVFDGIHYQSGRIV